MRSPLLLSKKPATVRRYGYTSILLICLYSATTLVPFYYYNIKSYYQPDIENSMPNAHQYFPYNQPLFAYFSWTDVSSLFAVLAHIYVPILILLMLWKLYVKRIPITKMERLIWTIIIAIIVAFFIITYRDTTIAANWLVN